MVEYIATRIRDESPDRSKAKELCAKLTQELQKKFSNVKSVYNIRQALVSIEYCIASVVHSSGYRKFAVPTSAITALLFEEEFIPSNFTLWSKEKIHECVDLRELITKVQSVTQEDTALAWHVIEFCRSINVEQNEWVPYCESHASLNSNVLSILQTVSADNDLLAKLDNGAANREYGYIVEQLASILQTELTDVQSVYAAIRKLSMKSIHNCKTQEELITLIKTGEQPATSNCEGILQRIQEYKAGEYGIETLHSMLPQLSYEEICVLVDAPEASIANCESLDELKELAHRYL